VREHDIAFGGNMRKAALLTCLLLAGCVSDPVPQDYSGPVANVMDSYTPRANDSADFFYVATLNGKKIDNNLATTIQANAGGGFAMSPMAYQRNIPIEPSTLNIVGRTHYAAPILELAGTVYEVSGNVSFTPKPNHHYLVKGVLGPTYSAVWIEDSADGSVIDKKIEIHGSSALGILSK
jgi:hypothetical protein